MYEITAIGVMRDEEVTIKNDVIKADFAEVKVFFVSRLLG